MAIFRRPHRAHCYASIAVPKSLQPLVGRQQVWRSLGTSDRRLALARQYLLRGKLSLVFEKVKQAVNHPEIHVLAKRWLQEALEELEEDLATQAPEDNEGFDLAITERLEQCELDLRTNRFDMVEEDAKALLQGVTLPPLAYSRFCRELLKVRVTYYQELKLRREGQYSPTSDTTREANRDTNQRSFAGSVLRPSEAPRRLSEVFPEYLEAFKRRAPKTIQAKRTALDRLVWIIGDKPISAITYEDLQRWRAVLLQLPIHADRNFPGATVDEVLAQVPGDAPRLSLTTVNGQRKKLAHFFNWCRKPPRKYLVENPCDGLHLEDAAEQHYDPYTDDDLRIIAPELRRQRELRPEYFWMIFLIAFTGCRLGEVAGLRRDDVKDSEGIPYLDIVPDLSKGRRLKTKASRRVIPIHSTLIKLGFLDWLTTRQGPTVFSSKGGTVSSWWGRLVKAKGITGKKALHSFRSTLITKLHAAGVDGETRRRLTGHTGHDVHETVYLHAPLTLLREALEKVSLPV